MNIGHRIKWYFELFGMRGVVSFCLFRLCGRPREISVRPEGLKHRVFVRLRTSDELAYASCLVEKEYEFELPFAPRVILDAGANIGATSIYFASKYPRARIVAVEAEASNFSMLVRNVQPYPAIVPVHAALWNFDGEIAIGEPDTGASSFAKWGFVARNEGSGERVRAVTLGTLKRELNLDACELVKIDIEGAEQEVFADTRWLAGTRCLMIELHDRFRPGCSEAVEAAMRGFSRSQRGETTFYLREA